MNANDVLKTYAIFYVSENDEFDVAKKLDMLQFIEQADEGMIMDLFENNEIESPFGLIDEVLEPRHSSANLIGETVLMLGEVDTLLENPEVLTEDMKNKLKDMLGMETDLKYKIGKAAGGAKDALEKQLGNLQGKIGDMRDAVAKGAGKAVKAGGEAIDKAKDVAGDVGAAAAKTAGKVGKAVKGATDDAGKAIEGGVKAAHKAVGAAADTAKDVAASAGDKVAGAAGKAAELAQGQGGMVGAAVAAAAALTAGVMAYRRFFSKAAQACKSSPDRAACMGQYKVKAKQAQISALNAGKAKCRKSKNAAGCAAKIDNKIASLKSKMRG